MDIIQTLSPIEREIIPYLNQDIEEIIQNSKKDKTTVLRALQFLEKKGLLKLKSSKKIIVALDVNGIYYKKNHLPERKLLIVLENNNHKFINDLKKISKLSDNEFKVSLGTLKKKALIDLKNGKISINSTKEELTKKFPEEILIEKLPIEKEKLSDLDLHALENLKSRKNLVEIIEKKHLSFDLTETGKQIAGRKIKSDLIEEITPKIIKEGLKNRKFRIYDLQTPVPKIFGGRKHFVNQSIEEGKQIWLDLGFKEMQGDLTQTSFWNFDALFTAQDHPVRELQDTYFIEDIEGKLPNKKLVSLVKKSHESGVLGSKGWQYLWDSKDAKQVVLRTHTTCLSAKKLSELSTKDLPAKFFSIGKCFRNETVDWSHGFEFLQSEGIVVDPNGNFRNLLGYLKEFYRKIGYEKIRITPAYFPYTEPSLEIHAYHPEKKVWLELGGAGIFRPEVTIPLLGTPIPVLAWGPGFDRLLLLTHGIKDFREINKNNLKQLKEIKSVIQ
jgi:phenylalanyl-tRNA synthetase alpha chain